MKSLEHASKEDASQFVASEMIDSRLDFIAIAYSYWHLLGISAIVNKHDYEKGAIIIGKPSKRNNQSLSVSGFEAIESIDLSVIRLKHAYSESLTIRNHLRMILGLTSYIFSEFLLTKKETLPIISPREPAVWILRSFSSPTVSSKYRIEFVIVDEGLGSYVSHEQRDAMREREKSQWEMNSSLWSKFDEIVPDVNDFLGSQTLRITDVEHRHLFGMEQRQLKLNGSVASDYASTLPKSREPQENLVVLATQPLSEGEKIEASIEKRIVESAVEQLSQSGHNVGLKIHPRENVNKYDYILNDVRILDLDEPIEPVLARLNPAAIVGFTTTALLTGSTICNVPAYTFAAEVQRLSENDRYCNLCSNFERWTGQYVSPFSDLVG